MVSREAFERYVIVQAEGQLNMFDTRVEIVADITKDEHLFIINNYEALREKYKIFVEDYY